MHNRCTVFSYFVYFQANFSDTVKLYNQLRMKIQFQVNVK